VPFIRQHIDSLIQILVGVSLTWLALRRPRKLGAGTIKGFRICGPALILIGALLLLRPTTALKWERLFTSDGVASAEFPGHVESHQSTDTRGSVAVRRTSFTYNVPGKDIALFLSFSALPEDARGMTNAQRLAATVSYFAAQGARIIQDAKAANGPVYRITIRQDDKKSTTQLALAYVGDKVYRVVASWTDGQEDKPLTDRFVNSFRVSSSRTLP
jgi:hypothetical protein